MISFHQNTINRFLQNLAENHVEIHAITVIHHGKVLCNKAFAPFDVNALHPLYSVTKSFTSIAFGFLEEEKHLPLSSKWISYFPKYRAIASKAFQQVTLKQLLTMSLGQDSEVMIRGKQDWIEQIVQKPIVYTPGTKFFYNSMCSYLIGRLVEEQTGQTLSNYLKKKLFTPLGIHDFYWEEDQQGHNLGGYGLHLKTKDLAKVGECILQHGMYKGKQIIPAAYLKEATKKQIENASEYPVARSENRQGYGYYFWMCSYHGFRASGLHGQMCYIHPKLNLVIALSSCTTGSQAILDCLYDAMQSTKSVKPVRFEIAPPIGKGTSHCCPSGTFRAQANPGNVEKLSFHVSKGKLTCKLVKDHKTYSICATNGKWNRQPNTIQGFSTFYTEDCQGNMHPKKYAAPMFASYAFVQPDLCEIRVRAWDCSSAYTFLFRIDPSFIVMDYTVAGLYTMQPMFETVFTLKTK